MVESVIKALIVIVLAVGLVLLTFWVLGTLGLTIPPPVRTVIMLVVALLVLLYLWRAFSGGFRL